MNATSPTPNTPPTPPGSSRFRERTAGLVRAFHNYASWLISISWKRFIVLSILLLICSLILENIPPFSWTTTELISEARQTPHAPKPPKPPREPIIKIEKAPPSESGKGVDIVIDERGVRISPKKATAASEAAAAASAAATAATESAAAASAAAAAAKAASSSPSITASTAPGGGARIEIHSGGTPGVPEVSISLPPGAASEDVRKAIEEVRREVQEAAREAKDAAEEAAREAAEAAREAAEHADGGPLWRTKTVKIGDFLSDLAWLWIVASAMIKIFYKKQVQAEVKAAQATETAEAESLKRQVVEARMAAMQAQVEPHFLFNTLASIDHLIEVDPPRASQMQKHLIALLRASMPTMREANDGGPRELSREISMVEPYLEILKVRMEDRLRTRIEVPRGLMSAEFPPMMIQTLVENAIKHGLEPKAEGGEIEVSAEIIDGRLAVTVADTGLGFGQGDTAGTGVGLANIRERLQLLYGGRATLTISENTPCGTRVVVSVPYSARVNTQDAAPGANEPASA